MFTYDIGGKRYVQKPLVLGQIRQLMALLKGFVVPAGEADIASVLRLLDDRLAKAVAIVLCEEGQSLKGKDVDALAEELEYELEMDTAVQVVEDFFACNPVVSLLQRITGAAGKIAEAIEGPTRSSRPSSISPEETSPSETTSSGDTPPGSASTT